MAFCVNCGIRIIDGANYCPVCGKEQHNNLDFSQRKQVYEGYIHKCPNCGGTIDSFVSKCPECGFEIRSEKKSSYVNELILKLEKVNSVENEKEIISNFYIPNTKEDIIEFMILASSNIKTGGPLLDAWATKLEQAYQKGRLSFGSAPEFTYIDGLYNESIKKAKRQNKTSILTKSAKYIIGSVLVLLGLLMMIIGGFLGHASGDGDSPFWMIAVLGLLFLMVSVPVFTSGKKKE